MPFENITKIIGQFVEVKEEDYEFYVKMLSVVHLKKNECWEPIGTIGKNMGFVNKGILRQYYTKDGEDFTEMFFSENEFFGNFISYLKNKPTELIIQALEPCEIVMITFDNLQKLYAHIPAAERFGRLIAEQKLIEMHDKTSAFLMQSPEERYAKLLESKPDIVQRVKQYYIAQYLGIRPESLSRIRKRAMK